MNKSAFRARERALTHPECGSQKPSKTHKIRIASTLTPEEQIATLDDKVQLLYKKLEQVAQRVARLEKEAR